jgi:hypothetical protein
MQTAQQSKTKQNSLKNPNNLNRDFSKECMQMANKYMKNHPPSQVISEI